MPPAPRAGVARRALPQIRQRLAECVRQRPPQPPARLCSQARRSRSAQLARAWRAPASAPTRCAVLGGQSAGKHQHSQARRAAAPRQRRWARCKRSLQMIAPRLQRDPAHLLCRSDGQPCRHREPLLPGLRGPANRRPCRQRCTNAPPGPKSRTPRRPPGCQRAWERALALDNWHVGTVGTTPFSCPFRAHRRQRCPWRHVSVAGVAGASGRRVLAPRTRGLQLQPRRRCHSAGRRGLRSTPRVRRCCRRLGQRCGVVALGRRQGGRGARGAAARRAVAARRRPRGVGAAGTRVRLRVSRRASPTPSPRRWCSTSLTWQPPRLRDKPPLRASRCLRRFAGRRRRCLRRCSRAPAAAQAAPGFWQLYTPRVSAMLLAGGPRLFERLVQETATGTALLVPRAPSPALVAHLVERHAVVAPGTKVGDCTSVEQSVPMRSPTQALYDAERRLWELEDDEHDDAQEAGASDDDAADAPGPADASRRAVRRTYPRGSPPPRAGRSPRRTTRRK